jgi:hypothetical protein
MNGRNTIIGSILMGSIILDVAVAAFAGIVPKGNRILAMDFSNPAENGDFNTPFNRVRAMGVQSIGMSFDWNQVETAPSTYTDPGNALAIANLVYAADNIQVSLILRPINGNSVNFPSDLSGKTFDDPTVISRFNAMMDFVFTKIPNLTLVNLQIGNEFDFYSGATPTFYAQFKTFLQQTNAHAKSIRSGLKVGFTATFAGMTGAAQSSLATLSAVVDEVGVTYYPLNADYTVKDPSVVPTDFQKLVNAFPNIPIYMAEVGYPTGPLCNSSEAQQAAFVSAVFQAWDGQSAHIPYVEFVRLHDWSLATAQQQATSAGILDPKFVEYLRTLGLRDYPGSGTDKQALGVFQAQAALRGWSTSVPPGQGGTLPGLGNIQIFPNPLRPAIGRTPMIFTDLPANTRLRIYTLRGELVNELNTGGSGTTSWDGTNQAGQKAASGVYIVYVQGAGDSKILKVAVQR